MGTFKERKCRLCYLKNEHEKKIDKQLTNAKRFSLYCGQQQRVLTEDQVEIMRQMAEFL